MKFFTPLFLFLFCATVFTNCSEDEPCDTTPKPAPNLDGYFKYIPYKTGDVLVFYNTLTKDTITFEGGQLFNNPVIIEEGDPLNGCLRYYEGKQHNIKFIAKNGQQIRVAYGHLYGKGGGGIYS